MSYRKALNYNQIAQHMASIYKVDALPSNRIVDKYIDANIHKPGLWGKFGHNPNAAVRGYHDYLGHELVDTLREEQGVHLKDKGRITKWIAERNLEKLEDKPYGKEPAWALDPALLRQRTGMRISPRVEEIMDRRKQLRDAVTSQNVTVNDETGEVSVKGENPFAAMQWQSKMEKDITEGKITTKGVRSNIIAGAGQSAWGGNVGNMKGLLPWKERHVASDAENAQMMNQLASEGDPFWKHMLDGEPVEAGESTMLEHVAQSTSAIMSMGAEFGAAGGLVKGATGLVGRTIMKSDKAAAAIGTGLKYLNNHKKIAATVDLAKHSVEEAAKFATHSVITGRPERMTDSALSGLLIGAGGGIGRLAFKPGIDAQTWWGFGLRTLGTEINAGLGFAGPMAAHRAINGEAFDPRFAIEEFMTGAILHTKALPVAGLKRYQYKKAVKLTEAREAANMNDWTQLTGLEPLDIDSKERPTSKTEGGKNLDVTEKKIKVEDTKIKDEPVIEYANDASEPVSTIGSLNKFMTGLKENLGYSLERSQEVQVKLEDLAHKSSNGRDFMRTAKEILGNEYTDMEKNSEVSEGLLRNVYNNAKNKAKFGSEDQVSYSVVEANGANVRVVPAEETGKYKPSELYDFKSLLGEILGARAHLIDGVVVNKADKQFSELSIGELTGMAAGLHEGDKFLLPFRGDSGKGFVANKHEKFADPKAVEEGTKFLEEVGAFEVPNAFELYNKPAAVRAQIKHLQESLSGKKYRDKAHAEWMEGRIKALKAIKLPSPEEQAKIDKQMHVDHGLNMHFYLQDLLGPKYAEHMKNSGQLGSIADLTKRFQIMSAKGVKFEANDIVGIDDAVNERGEKKLKFIIMPDDPDLTDTDGLKPIRSDVMDRMVEGFGTDHKEKISSIKSFDYLDPNVDPKNGAFLGKLKGTRAIGEQDQFMHDNGLHMIYYDSAAKFRGNREIYIPKDRYVRDKVKGGDSRKRGEIEAEWAETYGDISKFTYESVPEATRSMFSEHYEFKNEDGTFNQNKAKLFLQSIYYVDDNVIQQYMERGLDKVTKEMAGIDDPEKFQAWMRDNVLKVAKEDMQIDKDLPDQEMAVMDRALSATEKMLQGLNYSKLGLNSAQSKKYTNEAIHRYLVSNVLRPEIRGSISVLSGQPDWAKEMIKANDEIVVGSNYKDFFVGDIVKSGKLSVRDRSGKDIKVSFGNKPQTLGTIFEKYPNATVDVASVRAPVEDVGGIRAHRVVGIGPEGTGNSMYMRPREFNFLGGADSDFDKAAIYFEDGMKWRDALVGKYRNEQYIQTTKEAFENKTLQPDGTIRPKKEEPPVEGEKPKKKAINPNLYSAGDLITTAKSILNAKASIGRLMSLDRTLRTMRAHGYKAKNGSFLPEGDAYDKKMLYWKRTAVDAKHGGFAEWDIVVHDIVNNLFGSKVSGEVLSSGIYQDAADLYRKTFSRDFKHNKAWTIEEKQASSANYFSKYKPESQLERFVAAVPRFEVNNINDISWKALGKELKENGMSSGGGRFIRYLQENLYNSREKIDRSEITPSGANEIAGVYAQGLKEMSTDAADVNRLERATKRIADLLNRSQGEQQADLDFRKSLIADLRQQIKTDPNKVGKRMLHDMYTKANDFIPNDVWSIGTKKYLDAIDIEPPDRNAINGMFESAKESAKLLKDEKLTLEQKQVIVADIDDVLSALDKYATKDGRRHIRDYVGLKMLGSMYDKQSPEWGMYDNISKFGWNRYIDPGFMRDFGVVLNNTYKDVMSHSSKAKGFDPAQLKDVKEPVPEDASSVQRAFRQKEKERLKALDVDTAKNMLNDISGKNKIGDKANNILKNKAFEIITNPYSSWNNGLELVSAIIDRPSVELYNFDKYPLTIPEGIKLMKFMTDVNRSLKRYSLGDKNILAKTFWKYSTSSSVLEKAPETFEWYHNNATITRNHEVWQTELTNSANSIVAGVYEKYKNLDRSGEIVRALIRNEKLPEYTKEMTQEQVDVHRAAAKDVSILYDRAFRIMQPGYDAYILNTSERLRRLGVKEEVIMDLQGKLKNDFKKQDRYFTDYVKSIEEITDYRAEQLYTNLMIGETMTADQLAKVLRLGHTQKKTGEKFETVTNLEKVLHTYVDKVVPWSEHQRLQRNYEVSWKKLDKKITEMKESDGNTKFMEELATYYKSLGDFTLGKFTKKRDVELNYGQAIKKGRKIVGIENAGLETPDQEYFMGYIDQKGKQKYESLGKDQDIAKKKLMLNKFGSYDSIANNLSSTVLSLMFAKNIGGSKPSAVRNHFQKAYPTYFVSKSEMAKYVEWKHGGKKQFELGDGRTSYKAILADAGRQAGLEYGQAQGETGEKYQNETAHDKMMMRIMQEIDGSLKTNTYKVTDSIRKVASKIAEFSSTESVVIKGKTYGTPLHRTFSFGGAESSNRRLAFELGFDPIFRSVYERMRLGGANDADAVKVAMSYGKKAGLKMVDLTQFDYHSYNSPEVLRKAGWKGHSARWLFQFKKYPLNYYKMVRTMLLDAGASMQMNTGARKIYNKQVGSFARMLTWHAVFSGAGKITNLNLYNFLQEDVAASILDIFYWVTGQDEKLSYFAKKETPVPFLLGPNFGLLASSAMLTAGYSDYEVDEWMMSQAVPRGVKKQIVGGKKFYNAATSAKSTATWKYMQAIMYQFGVYPDYNNMRKVNKRY